MKTSELVRKGRITPQSLSMERYRNFSGDPNSAEDVATWLEANPLFDVEVADPETRETEVRKDQAKFRKAVGDAYDWSCAVTGCDIRAVLDAAHVGPKGAWLDMNEARHGILLRTDLHRLFDAGLARISRTGDTAIYEVAPEAMLHYEWAHNKTLTLPKDKRNWPVLG